MSLGENSTTPHRNMIATPSSSMERVMQILMQIFVSSLQDSTAIRYGYDVYSFIKDDALKAIVPNRGGIPTDLQRVYSTAEGIPGHLSA